MLKWGIARGGQRIARRLHFGYGEHCSSNGYQKIILVKVNICMIATLAMVAGILGLLAITVGVILTHERQQDVVFIVGGVLLAGYSAYRGDPIFLLLQVVFIVVAVAELIKLSGKKHWLKRLQR